VFVEGDINSYIDFIPDHDILTGGFPCQPFSKAGKKQGIDDYRGTLFEAIVKIVRIKKPNYFVLENVNSLLYMENGRHFRTILYALSSLDYKIEWRVLNATSFGLPQNRERVIIVGSKNQKTNQSYFLDQNEFLNIPTKTLDVIARFNTWKDILQSKGKFSDWGMAYQGKFVSFDIPLPVYSPQKKLKDVLQSDVDLSFDFTADTLLRIEKSQYVNKYYNGVQILYNQAGGARMGYSIFGIDGVAPTLTASTSRHYERYCIGTAYRRLTNVEYARIQGFPDNHCKATSPYNQYKLYGNAVPPQMIEFVLHRIINNHYTEIEKQEFTLFDLWEE
jgi:DNA (cytosine-5)-methyltransferase 1